MKRIYSIDTMRGIVMIIMALDHVRDIMHTQSLAQTPTDLTTTYPALFFTRWITHLCAPSFVFLSGASAFLVMQRNGSKKDTSKFLFQRGLWLIILEFTLVNFGLWFDIHFTVLISDVIAAIGFGFIILSLLIRFPPKSVLIAGIAVIFLHALVPMFINNSSSAGKGILAFFRPAAFPFDHNRLFIMGYPPVPWLGIMLAGFGAAPLFLMADGPRKKILQWTGIAAIALACLLRFINRYGDSFPWAVQKSRFFTFLSYINFSKYPPSLDFCLIFLGIMLLLLALLDNVRNSFTEFVSTYGRVPLFYFVTHWYLIHLLLFIVLFSQGYHWADFVFGTNFGRPKTGGGIGLWYVYLAWAGIVIAFYQPCKWFWRYKKNHPELKWLRFI
ncbi:MAG TPA: heparan-alpha-glucosaminide N-acetyltransferase domain-containing protein [Chitinophagaceae bacterium]